MSFSNISFDQCVCPCCPWYTLHPSKAHNVHICSWMEHQEIMTRPTEACRQLPKRENTNPHTNLVALCCFLHWVRGFDFLIFCFLFRVMIIIPKIVLHFSMPINHCSGACYIQWSNDEQKNGKSGRSRHQLLQRLESTAEGPTIQDGFRLTPFYSSTVLQRMSNSATQLFDTYKQIDHLHKNP